MRLILVVLAVMFGFNSHAQITLHEMNGITPAAGQEEVESVIGEKIEIPGDPDHPDFSTTVKRDGVAFELSFANPCAGEERPCYILQEIATVSTKIKTSERVGVGSSLEAVKKAYAAYNQKENCYTGMLEDRDCFYVRDNEKGVTLYFDVTENKVTKIGLFYFPAD